MVRLRSVVAVDPWSPPPPVSPPSRRSALVVGQVAGQDARRDVARPAGLAVVVELERAVPLADLGQGASGLLPCVPLLDEEPPGLPGEDGTPLIDRVGVECRPGVAVGLATA